MSWLKISGIAGSFLLLAGIILPVAELNQNVISILPVWQNYSLSGGLWNWRDISFFSFSALVLIFLSIYFSVKNRQAGLIATGLLLLFISLLIMAFMFEVKARLYGLEGISFSLSWGWLIILPSAALILFSGLIKNGSGLKEKRRAR